MRSTDIESLSFTAYGPLSRPVVKTCCSDWQCGQRPCVDGFANCTTPRHLHASASLSHSSPISARRLRLRRREKRRVTRRAVPLRTRRHRNDTPAPRSRVWPDNAARRAPASVVSASQCSRPRRRSAVALSLALRRTPARHRARASPDRSRRRGTPHCAPPDASAGAAERRARALRKPLRRLWTHHDLKSCERWIEVPSDRFLAQWLRLLWHARHSPHCHHPAALPLHGTMLALLCLSASSAS
jgi:hypothetical protein